ncbi:MAG: chlorite dismutase family protein [Patulibacter sp.]|nr:chlorite dismutase family protein [Patulibacter sp.]
MSEAKTYEVPPISGNEPKGLEYALYAAYSGDRGDRRLDPSERAAAAAEATEALQSVDGAHLRGVYSLVGFRAEADILFWLVGETADALQEALVALQHTHLGRSLTPWWTNIGVHREAEFNKGHVPAFFAGEDPQPYLCVYPFVRSLDWYLLEPEERSGLLREHGMMGRDYPDVRANTISAFALGDYEWLLSFEATELTRIVDLMRHLRGAEARRHTREELPFLTGLRKPLADAVADLP